MSHANHRGSVDRVARIAVLTVSDTRTAQTDRSGRRIQELALDAGQRVVAYEVLPDEPEQVGERLRQWLGRDDCDCVIVNGGTGISRRDRTHEVVVELLEARLDGFGELFRYLSYQEIGAAAMLSRAVGGLRGGKLLFSLPGSTPAVELGMRALILPELGHMLAELVKDGSQFS